MVCPANGRTVDEYTIQAADIIELVEAPRESTLSPKITPPQPQRFEDPAILSMGRKPAASIVPDADNMPLYKTTPILRADSARTVREDRALKDSTPVSSLVEPMAQLQSSLQEMGDTDAMMLSELEAKHDVSPIQPANAQRKKRSRRKNHTRKAGEESADLEVIPARETVRSKGWRQTPLLEPTSSFQPFATLKKRARGNGRMDDSGWATEDATDVQDLGDFDFQGSLAKFDKHTIFHQLQAKDSVAAEDRLVAHNRLPRPKPGTAGGKNLHHSEMVLQSPTGSHKHVDRWRSEAGESDFDGQASHKDAGTGSGRHSRKAERADSRVSAMRHSVSRKGSGNAAPPTRSHSVSVPCSVPIQD